jgi:pyridoxamine 5'-phosphate oxidase
MNNHEMSTDRVDYGLGQLELTDLKPHPIDQLNTWLAQAKGQEIKDYNAFVFGVVDDRGYPTSRIVLLRDCTQEGLTFFTNYHSAKGRAIAGQTHVSLNFFWSALERQVRVLGHVQKVSEQESDTYFASRPRESQIGAWASDQSAILANREELTKAVEMYTQQFDGMEVPRPPHWGGYRVVPIEFEFWQGRKSRLHDRFQYVKDSSSWKIFRLNP